MAGLALPLVLWGSTLGVAIAEGTPEDLSDREIVLNLLLSIVILDGIFLALPAAFCLRRYRQGWAGLGLRGFDTSLWWLPVVAAAGAHLGLIAYGLLLVLVGADGALPEQDIEDMFDSRAVLPLVGVATVLVAPLAEEVFFRGFVFSGLIRPLGLWPAMVASGLLFGAFHVTGPDSVGLVVPFGVIGMIFAWLYYRTGSLWPSIAAHLIFNLVSFVVLASVARVPL